MRHSDFIQSTAPFRRSPRGNWARSAQHAEPFRPGCGAGHQLHPPLGYTAMVGQEAGHRIVGPAVRRSLGHVDCQVCVDAGLDQRTLPAAGFDLDGDDVAGANHAPAV